jgi:hypothetical protein
VRRRRLTALFVLPGLAAAGGALAGCGIKISMVRPTPTLVPDSAVPRIDVDVAYDQVRAGKAVLVDVRGDDPWRARHATGALSVPIEDIESAPLKALAVVPAGKQPILYCT